MDGPRIRGLDSEKSPLVSIERYYKYFGKLEIVEI